MRDILGKCAFSWWISWANVQYHEGYLGQMCVFLVDILGKCATPQGISWANMQYDEGCLGKYLDKLVYMITCLKLLKKDGVITLVDIYNSDKMGVP
jgi:hypothetical protein